ncbi:asparagine synthase (glutamine-hydrolyzing) [Pedobacter sp. UYEF25]
MCRIAGIINTDESKETLASHLKKMCDLMAHGGPDDEGYYINEEIKLGFGHRRLALIDLSSAGHQPMFYDDKKICITYNGEIYNYKELKKELETLGCLFISESDTEVILAAYATWGTASFGRLNGMFAFALYDKQQQKTFLARDFYGIKPLYYSNVEGNLVFASEVKVFKTLPYHYSENPNWRTYFLAFGHIPEPHTTLAEVKMLPKAQMLIWDHKSNSLEIRKYEQTDSLQSAENYDLKENIKNSVKSHLVSDASIGVFLSGGIDSSIIAIEANATLDKRSTLNTLSINFEEEDFSEKKYQDLVVEQIECSHSSYVLDEQIFGKHFHEALRSMDQPSTDGINSWFISRFAKERGLKAVLSGIGADELFGGYPSFKRMAMFNLIAALPKFILKSFLKSSKPAIRRLYYLSYGNTAGKYLALRGFFCPDEIAEMLDKNLKEVDATLRSMQIEEMLRNLRSKEQAGWLETNMYMQNQLLKDTDAMSMQHGVEVRVPFLDKRISEALAQIPYKKRFDKHLPKSLLINTFKPELPQQIWDRKKMGFTFPFGKWLRNNKAFIIKLETSPNKKAIALASKFKNNELHWSKALAVYLCFRD